MSRLTQILRNSYIRLEAFLSVVFKNFFNLFRSVFGFFGKTFGFSNSQYFLEPDQAQGVKRTTTQPSVEESRSTKAPEVSTTARRRPNPQMDYYRKMAQEVNKK